MSEAAAKTALGPTVLVAIEQSFPKHQRIIEDDWAYRILPFRMRALAWLLRPAPLRNWMVGMTERSLPGIWSAFMCRKRYVEQKVSETVHQLDGVVNLGSGFDTLAYRVPSLLGTPFWEVDQPAVIKPKRERVRAALGRIPQNRKFVAMDFDHENLETVLEAHGYTLHQRTFFIWEAVTQYLAEEGIRATFAFLSKAQRGSRLIFTYVLKDFLQGHAMYGWERGYKEYVATGLWKFGMDPEVWPDFLGEYGWQIIEDVGYDQLAEEYVEPTGRALDSAQIERVVYAEKL